MKKMLLASVVIAGLATFASCSKNYTCTCTSVEPNGTVIDVTKETISGRESSAEDKCKQRDHVNGTITTTCLID
jgi:hypothetical protein